MLSIDLSISDHSQLGALESLLKRTMPELAITRSSGSPLPGELGWQDVLVIVFAGISALADTIGLVREYLDSRANETGITITATSSTKRHTKSLEVRHATAEQVAEFLDWFTDE